jgi:hypothetical protein
VRNAGTACLAPFNSASQLSISSSLALNPCLITRWAAATCDRAGAAGSIMIRRIAVAAGTRRLLQPYAGVPEGRES